MEELIMDKEKFAEHVKKQLVIALYEKDSAMVAVITELVKLFEIKI
ncbi:hypothetical protein PFZ79_001066 [Enterococcus hirae]|nr:hypothetical protein [Enterococcus hirae]